MGWEFRGTNRYFYRVRRQGNRVLKEYVGAGEKGMLAAAQDAEVRELADVMKRRNREQDQSLLAMDADQREIDSLTELLLTAELLCHGWKKHHGSWRPTLGKRNGSRTNTN